jgi:soluble lytic murein transglycosylase-like protein
VEAPESIRNEADLELLEIANATIAAHAASRLATDAPDLLRRHSRNLEKTTMAALTDLELLDRAAGWRRAGLGSRGAAELRSRRFRGELETARRKELARCELDAGSTTRCLNALPARSASDAEALVLRAEAYRRRGWGKFPDTSASTAFTTCLAVASEVKSDDPATRDEALALVLECGTESGKTDRAIAAWRQLEASGWDHPRRGWLGRRLGVAVARGGADDRFVEGLATALPQHERCLRFWRSLARSDAGTLTDLASAPIHDLYGRWVSIDVPDSERLPYTPADPAGAADPTPAVAWLLENAGPAEAFDEWQRVFGLRRPTRSEALAAAALAEHTGRANTAIRMVLAGFPEIASTAIAECPADAVSAYLPLRYTDHLVAAADRSGLDPWVLAALARQESTFIAHARSPAGARGVLQLLPSTARLHSRALGLGSRPDLEDPAINIRLGARELATLIRKYGALEPALAAYNAGERRVRRWWRRWPDPRVFSESVPIPETYSYIRRVVFLSDAYRQIYAHAWEEKP